jgi:PAS domain S-box-containing protein
VSDAEAILFGEEADAVPHCRFEIDSAYQGQEGLEKIKQALAEGKPYAMAFVDVRMPPGWDGIETITRIWPVYPQIQVVICTAYSDYSWRDIVKTLGRSDSLVILKKPFDAIEVLQLAHALTTKWEVSKQARCKMQDLDRMVNERTEELRATNDRLRHSEERFSKAFNGSPFPMAIQSLANERLVDANESFLSMTGFDRSTLVGHSLGELQVWSERPVRQEFVEQLKQEKSVRNFPCRLRSRSGEVREAVLFAELLTLGQESHVLLAAVDVTERMKLEDQLRQAHKMEAGGPACRRGRARFQQYPHHHPGPHQPPPRHAQGRSAVGEAAPTRPRRQRTCQHADPAVARVQSQADDPAPAHQPASPARPA